MTMEHWRNESDRRKQKYVEKNLSQWHCIIIIIIIIIIVVVVVVVGLHCSPVRTSPPYFFFNLSEISNQSTKYSVS